jgi:hypothetical protein
MDPSEEQRFREIQRDYLDFLDDEVKKNKKFKKLEFYPLTNQFRLLFFITARSRNLQ